MQKETLVLFCVVFILTNGQLIQFDLSDYDASNKTTHIQSRFSFLSEEAGIWVRNIPSNAGFFIVQVHTFLQNISLSSTPNFQRETTIIGTNIGLVSFNHKDTEFYLKFSNSSLMAFILVTIYSNADPIPGGCNLSFPTEYAPYQLTSFTDDLIIVQSQPPSTFNSTCDQNNIQVDMYHLYLPENTHDHVHYFAGIQKMLTPDLIKSNGVKVPTVDGYFKYRKLYSAYRGVGQVFAIVATSNGRSSAYVPAVSYGCDLTNFEENCINPTTIHWKFICAFLLISGFFVNFVGHKFFRITLFLMGFVVGLSMSYVVLSQIDFSIEVKTTFSIVVGVLYGFVWLKLWLKLGIPIFSASITFFVAGFLIASIIYYSALGDLDVFRNNVIFWTVFVSIILMNQIFCVLPTTEGHCLGCSFVGTYACVAALSHYTGGNLQYIIINTFRRMIVKNFNMATIDPPFQLLDVGYTVWLIAMTFIGFYCQWKLQRGRSPFPPHTDNGLNERAPLLDNYRYFEYN